MISLRLLVPVTLLSILALAAAAVRVDAARRPERTLAHEGRRTVQWVFTARDLISCKSAAYTLRHLRAVDPSVAVVAYGIDVKEVEVRSFLRSERLDVELVIGSARSYEKQFNRRPLSGLYVLWGDSVVRVPGRAYPDPAAVQELLQSVPPSVEPHGRTTPSPRSSRRNL